MPEDYAAAQTADKQFDHDPFAVEDETKMQEVDGVYYADIGDGPPLLFIHSLGLNSGMWATQVPLLAQRYRVIRVDVRGHGRTPYNGETLTIEMLAADIRRLAANLGLEQMAVVGLSMGGLIAQQIAIDEPGTVAALVLVSTVSKFTEQGKKALLERAAIAEARGMEPLIQPAIERWFTQAFREAAEAPPVEGSQGAHNTLLAPGSSELYQATMVGTISRMLEYADPHGYAAACHALAAVDLTSQLGKIGCPTLVVSGKQDPDLDRATQEILLERIVRSSEAVFPNASHLVPVECADEFNSQLLTFLAWSNYR